MGIFSPWRKARQERADLIALVVASNELIAAQLALEKARAEREQVRLEISTARRMAYNELYRRTRPLEMLHEFTEDHALVQVLSDPLLALATRLADMIGDDATYHTVESRALLELVKLLPPEPDAVGTAIDELFSG